MWQPRTGPFHTEPPLFKAAKHQVTSGQPQMGFLFPCSDCKPLTRLTSKDTQHRSTEVRPDRTRATPFPSQAAALHIHTLTFAFCKKMIFFFLNLKRRRGEVAGCLGRKVAVAGFWSNISITETFPTPGFCLFLGRLKGRISKVCTSNDKWGN